MAAERVITVGPFTYTRRDFTPKCRGQKVGHSWYREHNGHRNECGMEAVVLVDEIARLRAVVAERESVDAMEDN